MCVKALVFCFSTQRSRVGPPPRCCHLHAPDNPGAARRQIEISLGSKCSPDFVCVFNLSPSLTFWSSSHRDGKKKKKDMKLAYLNAIYKGSSSLQAPQKSFRSVHIRQLQCRNSKLVTSVVISQMGLMRKLHPGSVLGLR